MRSYVRQRKACLTCAKNVPALAFFRLARQFSAGPREFTSMLLFRDNKIYTR